MQGTQGCIQRGDGTIAEKPDADCDKPTVDRITGRRTFVCFSVAALHEQAFGASASASCSSMLRLRPRPPLQVQRRTVSTSRPRRSTLPAARILPCAGRSARRDCNGSCRRTRRKARRDRVIEQDEVQVLRRGLRLNRGSDVVGERQPLDVTHRQPMGTDSAALARVARACLDVQPYLATHPQFVNAMRTRHAVARDERVFVTRKQFGPLQRAQRPAAGDAGTFLPRFFTTLIP